MSKIPWSAYDEWNILVVIVTQICHSGQPSHGGDRNIFEVMISPLLKGTLASVASVLSVSSITEILIGATRSRISYHLRDIYSICMCFWYGATHKWKVHNGKIDIISFVVKFCRFRGVSQDEPDLSLSVVSFISFPMGYMRSTELFSERTSSS